MKKMLILIDQRGYLAGSRLPGKLLVDVTLLRDELEKSGFEVKISSIHAITFPSKYKGWFVVYPSSEDPGLFYKSYIEDILLGLLKEGAILLPNIFYFRAHHNKMFMEICRKSLPEEYNTINSIFFYDINDFQKEERELGKYPIVIKTSEGSSSAGVYIAYDKNEAEKIINKVSHINYHSSIYPPYAKLKDTIKSFLIRKGLWHKSLTTIVAHEKMVAQSYIDNLLYDYKILVFGNKYYVLRRGVREHDFRASGSGKFIYPQELNDELLSVLEYVLKLYDFLFVPLLSADIAYDGRNSHLIEFQCVNFGPYTLEYSEQYYEKKEKKWRVIREKSSLEVEMARAYTRYIEKIENENQHSIKM